MVETGAIWKFFSKYIFFNWIFVIAMFMLVSSYVVAHFLAQQFVGDSIVDFNHWISILIQINIFISLLFIVLLVYFVFYSPKTNDLQKFLLLSAYSRNKLFIVKSWFVMFWTVLFNLIEFGACAILSSLFNQDNFFALDVSLLVLSLVMAIIFLPIMIFLAISFKKVLLAIISLILVLSIPGSFLISRVVAAANQGDNLSYQYNANKNNYVKMYQLDKYNQIEGQYVLGIANFSEETTKNLESSFVDSINPTKNSVSQFMLGEIFTQFASNLMPQTQYTFDQYYLMSNQSHLLNLDLIATKKYKSGDPVEISNLEDDTLVYISFQDQDPFQMTYQEILDGYVALIEKLNLVNLEDEMKSILQIDQDYPGTWLNVDFTTTQHSILQAFAGQENRWMYYILKYKSLLEDKFYKIFDDIEVIFNSQVRTFLEFILQEDNFAANVTSYKTILDLNNFTNNFPDIGRVSELEKANKYDLNFFKNDLINFVENEQGLREVQILNSEKTYQEIVLPSAQEVLVDPEMKELKDALATYQSWTTYIDKNSTVNNLKAKYNLLFRKNPSIEPEYAFLDNSNYLYDINYVLTIENKKWLDNALVSVIILGGIGVLIWIVTYILNKKQEVNRV